VATFEIRQPTIDDAEWITRACQDIEIQRWTLVPRPYKREHALGFIENTINEAHRWVIEQQETNEPVGVVSIHSIDTDTGDADVGYWIAPWGRRRGAAVHALYLVEQFALTIPSIKFLSAHIAESNAASRATASRAGFINMGSTPEPCPDGESLVPALTYVKQLAR
jgi:RimJ/RimL family protein N-acetyltransferase